MDTQGIFDRPAEDETLLDRVVSAAEVVRHRRPVDEMARVLRTSPRQLATASEGFIAHWAHGALHDTVEPMADHVVMTYVGAMQRLERRTGGSMQVGTARPDAVTIIPAGSSARWDIPGRIDVLQLYLPHATLKRIAAEAGRAFSTSVVERTGFRDPTTSRLLASAAEVLGRSESLDTLFPQQIIELIATRVLSAHTSVGAPPRPVTGGLSPAVLRRAIERLSSDCDADVSLAALASEAHLSRFHFCRAFKESTGLSPHAWLRQHRLAQALTLLRDTNEAVISIAVALGYGSQSAFATAFRRLTGETPSSWRRRAR